MKRNKKTKNDFVLSIIVPVYNEEKTLKTIVKKVESSKIPRNIKKELIFVDDASSDKSRQIIKQIVRTKKLYKYHFQIKNQGKGAAVVKGLSIATGDIMLVQDADLEYDPNDYSKLLKPILERKSPVVYGSRFKSAKGHLKQNPLTYYVHYFGNYSLTMLTNVLFLTWITDMETCYKVFTRRVYEKIKPLKAKRFDLEPEITAKLLKKGFRIKEVPISYFSRSFEEGKKITWRDGLKAFYYLVKYRLFD